MSIGYSGHRREGWYGDYRVVGWRGRRLTFKIASRVSIGAPHHPDTAHRRALTLGNDADPEGWAWAACSCQMPGFRLTCRNGISVSEVRGRHGFAVKWPTCVRSYQIIIHCVRRRSRPREVGVGSLLLSVAWLE